MVRCCLVLAFGSFLVTALAGCVNNQRNAAPPQTPVVPISQPVERNVTDFVDFTGRTEAVQSVNIVPRVTGYLVQEPFKEGAEVKKDALLFQVDPRPYKAQLDQAQAQVNLFEAQLKLAKTTLGRDLAISKTKGAVSEQQLDQDRASVEQAVASVKAAQASVEVFKLNLGFCDVTSPIDGQVARYFLTLGNLVNQDQTLLTTVVSQDPMYAYFDMDESTLLHIKAAVVEGKIKRYAEGKIPVFMGLANEEGFPHQGTIDFVNNQVNPTTGSISVRAVYANPRLAGGIRLLSPGMFVRIHLPIGQPYPALLVVDRAIASDQGLKYVYVVDADKKLRYQRVQTGALQSDGLRVIKEGLKKGDWVVVGGLQQIQPRMQIQTDPVTMPTLASDEQAAQPAGKQGQPAAARKPATQPATNPPRNPKTGGQP